MATLKERFIRALEARGQTFVKQTHKYTVYTRMPPGTFYYIGRSGSLRAGVSVQGSLPCSEAFKQKLLEEAGT